MKINIQIKISITLIYICGILSFFAQPVNAKENNVSIMQEAIKEYKDGLYIEAQKTANKNTKYAHEKAVKKMPAKMKDAYNRIIKKYANDNQNQSSYYLTDIDNDQSADLIVMHGTCEADMKMNIYSFKKNKVEKSGADYYGNMSFHAYYYHNGIIMYTAQTGYEQVFILKLLNGKVKCIKIGERVLDRVDEAIDFRCRLKEYNSSIQIK